MHRTAVIRRIGAASLQDLRLSCRTWLRAKAFTALAVLTLATGIAATAIVWSLVDGVLLRPLPMPEQDRLLVAWKTAPASVDTRWPFRAPEIDVIREAARGIEAIAGVGYQDPSRVIALENGSASYLHLSRVTGDFFHVLGVRPVLGRTLGRDDDAIGAERVAVITHGLWQRRYGGARDVLGRRFIVNEQPFTIVGVMPRGIDYPRGVEGWVTRTGIASTITNATFRDAALTEVGVVARLRPGIEADQVARELRMLVPRLDEEAPPGAIRGLVPSLRRFDDALVGEARGALMALLAAVALVLLVAGANVANLLVIRGLTRQSEFSIRAALGASRARLAGHVLAESLVLACAAGTVGLIVAWLGLPTVVALVAQVLPGIDAVRIDLRVVLFTIALAFATAILAGAVPALSSSRANLAWRLAAVRARATRATRRTPRALVIVQVALAMTTLSAAGLLARSLFQLDALGTSLGADRLMLVPLALPEPDYASRDRRLQFLTAAVEQLEASPLVTAATPVNVVPFTGIGWDVPIFTAEGQSRERAMTNPSLNLEAIHPSYFDTFEVRLLRGRAFSPADSQDATRVAIVSADVAARTWPGEDPIGKRLKMGSVEAPDEWLTVVGVAAPTRYRELTEPRATLYVPAEQLLVTAGTLVLRTTASPAAVAALAAERIRGIDPAVRVMRAAPFRELLGGPLARPRLQAWLTGVFALIAVLLAAIGVYGVLAALVRLREREIGIRLAFGAGRTHVRGLVLGEALRLAGIGAAVGLALAIGGSGVLRGLLFGVTPLDPAALLGAACLLVASCAAACYVPVRRATRIDPAGLLRAE